MLWANLGREEKREDGSLKYVLKAPFTPGHCLVYEGLLISEIEVSN